MGKARQAEGGALSSSQSPKWTHSERSAVGGAVKPGFFFFFFSLPNRHRSSEWVGPVSRTQAPGAQLLTSGTARTGCVCYLVLTSCSSSGL